MKQFTMINNLEMKTLSDVKYKDRIITIDHVLLLGILRSLSRLFPCVATDEFIAEVRGTKIRNLKRWLKVLEDVGFIKIEVIKRKRTIFIEEENILLAIREINPEVLEEDITSDPIDIKEEVILKEDLKEEPEVNITNETIDRVKAAKVKLNITNNDDLVHYFQKALGPDATIKSIEGNEDAVLAVLEEANSLTEKQRKADKMLKELPEEHLRKLGMLKEALGYKNRDDLNDSIKEALDDDDATWVDLTKDNVKIVISYLEQMVRDRVGKFTTNGK